jgi:hypothetical protein
MVGKELDAAPPILLRWKVVTCKQGEVIRRPSATDINWPVVLNVQFSGNSLYNKNGL